MKKWLDDHSFEIDCVFMMIGIAVYFAMMLYCW